MMTTEGRQDGGPRPLLSVVVTYLDMEAPPSESILGVPAPPGATVHRVRNASPGYYRRLYDGVGENWLWHERRQMTASQLRGILHSPNVLLLVLRHNRRTAGFAELDRRGYPVVRLAYFGLMPGWIGRGLGRWFLSRVVAEAWQGETSLLRVNTCSLDHPAALPLYLKMGFVPVRHVVRQVPDPRLTGILPRTAAPHIPLAGTPLEIAPLAKLRSTPRP